MTKKTDVKNIVEYEDIQVRPIYFGWGSSADKLVHFAIAEGRADVNTGYGPRDKRVLITGCGRVADSFGYLKEYEVNPEHEYNSKDNGGFFINHAGYCEKCQERYPQALPMMIENLQRFERIDELEGQAREAEREAGYQWNEIGSWIEESINNILSYGSLDELGVELESEDILALASGDEDLLAERSKYWEAATNGDWFNPMAEDEVVKITSINPNNEEELVVEYLSLEELRGSPYHYTACKGWLELYGSAGPGYSLTMEVDDKNKFIYEVDTKLYKCSICGAMVYNSEATTASMIEARVCQEHSANPYKVTVTTHYPDNGQAIILMLVAGKMVGYKITRGHDGVYLDRALEGKLDIVNDYFYSLAEAVKFINHEEGLEPPLDTKHIMGYEEYGQAQEAHHA